MAGLLIFKKKPIYFFFILIGVSLATPILAYVMSNNDYYMQSDSINFAGGMSSSSDYKLEDTLGEIGSGNSSNTDFGLDAGYQQSEDNRYLVLTVPDSLTMTPEISGISGGVASGTSVVNVLTNNQSGYTLMIRSSSSPALQTTSTGFSFSDYTNSSAPTPDFIWNIDSDTSEFGFTVDGLDIVQNYRDNGSVCNQLIDSYSEHSCWSPLLGNNTNISYSNSPNHSSGGSNTLLEFMAESGPGNVQEPGVYQSQVILTAFMN